MNFSNQTVLPTALPAFEDVTFHPLEEDFLTVERISLGITFLVILIVAVLLFAFIDSLQQATTMILGGVVLMSIFILSYVTTNISYKFSGYALREHDILFKSGWLIRKVRIVMLNRIQHVSVQSGPIERKFGLSSVSLYTAGSSQADFTMTGISEETAQSIKQWIGKNMDGSTNK